LNDEQARRAVERRMMGRGLDVQPGTSLEDMQQQSLGTRAQRALDRSGSGRNLIEEARDREDRAGEMRQRSTQEQMMGTVADRVQSGSSDGNMGAPGTDPTTYVAAGGTPEGARAIALRDGILTPELSQEMSDMFEAGNYL
jgi:hypothetical protein